MTTGYFAIPGARDRGNKVHIVHADITVCGATPSKKAQYQWCAPGIKYDYLDCKNCQALANDPKVNARLTRLIEGRDD